jgi:hypothetical protein
MSGKRKKRETKRAETLRNHKKHIETESGNFRLQKPYDRA